MSTFAPTLSFDQASARANLFVDRKEYLDGGHINLGVFESFEKAYGAKMGPDHDGTTISVIPIAVRQHATSTGFQTGTEEFDLDVSSTDEAGPAFRMGIVKRPVVVNVAELRQCGDQAGLNDFLLGRFQMTKASCQREAARHIVAGGVAAYEACVPGYGPAFSFNGIDHATYGIVEHRAFGSQTNVIAGFSKATWSDQPQTQNIVMDVASNFAASGLSQMFALKTRLRKYAMTKGFWFGLITEACYNLYKNALGSQELYLKEGDLNGGWMPTAFGDVPLFIEEFMPISTTYGGSTSNTNKASLIIYNAKNVYPKWSKPMSVTSNGMTVKEPGGRFEFGSARQLPVNAAWATECNIGFNLWWRSFAPFGVLLNAES